MGDVGEDFLVSPAPDWWPCSRCGKDCDARGRRKNVLCFYCNREIEAKDHTYELRRRLVQSLPARFRDADFSKYTCPTGVKGGTVEISGKLTVTTDGRSGAGTLGITIRMGTLVQCLGAYDVKYAKL